MVNALRVETMKCQMRPEKAVNQHHVDLVRKLCQVENVRPALTICELLMIRLNVSLQCVAQIER